MTKSNDPFHFGLSFMFRCKLKDQCNPCSLQNFQFCKLMDSMLGQFFADFLEEIEINVYYMPQFYRIIKFTMLYALLETGL